MATAQGVAGQRAVTKATVLVVDDERAVLELLRLHLENDGYTVIAAADAVIGGKALVERAAEIDLLILDAKLPYMSGIEFASVLIADTTLPPIPMILITGHEEFADRAVLLDVPCLMKPFSADRLLELVEKTLARTPKQAAAALKQDGIGRLVSDFGGTRR